MKVFRQRNVGKSWGFFMQIIQQEAIVVQGTILLLSLITTASVLQIRGFQIPVWLLAVVVGLFLIVGAVAIWAAGMPSYFKAFNDQFYKHGNPMRKDIEKIMVDQKKIMEYLGIKDED